MPYFGVGNTPLLQASLLYNVASVFCAYVVCFVGSAARIFRHCASCTASHSHPLAFCNMVISASCIYSMPPGSLHCFVFYIHGSHLDIAMQFTSLDPSLSIALWSMRPVRNACTLFAMEAVPFYTNNGCGAPNAHRLFKQRSNVPVCQWKPRAAVPGVYCQNCLVSAPSSSGCFAFCYLQSPVAWPMSVPLTCPAL